MAKIPPPPPIANEDPIFNRWLLELTSILSSEGDIDPGSIAGYPALQAQVAQNTSNIASLINSVASLQGAVGTLQTALTALTSRVSATESAITSLQSRAQVFNGSAAPIAALGNDNDYYVSTGASKHLYVKLAGAWVQIV